MPAYYNTTPLNRRTPWVTGLVLLVLGVPVLLAGFWLGVLGGTWYYLLAGLGFVLTGVLLMRRSPAGLWVFAVLIGGTLAWAIWETGLDWWPLAARGDVFFRRRPTVPAGDWPPTAAPAGQRYSPLARSRRPTSGSCKRPGSTAPATCAASPATRRKRPSRSRRSRSAAALPVHAAPVGDRARRHHRRAALALQPADPGPAGAAAPDLPRPVLPAAQPAPPRRRRLRLRAGRRVRGQALHAHRRRPRHRAEPRQRRPARPSAAAAGRSTSGKNMPNVKPGAYYSTSPVVVTRSWSSSAARCSTTSPPGSSRA
jgi:hypothetical protein